MTPEPEAPRATYRVQFGPDFGFDDAARLAPHLVALGVTHLYASPSLQAAAGSTHGYDVVDHRRLSADLGGAVAHARLCSALDAAGLGQVLDIVPNHMAIADPGNAWWWDVLENGPSSQYASYFDVDWDPPEEKLRDRVLLPYLEDQYGRVLEAGGIRLEHRQGGFVMHAGGQVVPVAPRSLDDLLAEAARRCGSDELESIAAALGRLPRSTEVDEESVRERHRDKEVLRAHLARLEEETPEVAAAIDLVVDEINADVDTLDSLLERQNYRLAHWRTAGRELGYRRFFDIHTLAGLRTEDPLVFADTHELVLDLVGKGAVCGLRIDHPDGLRDPEGYLRRLADATTEAAPGAAVWTVVEKILVNGERLPPTWPVAGTTGYDFLQQVTGLFVDPDGEEPLGDLYARFTGRSDRWPELAVESRRLVLREVLATEVRRLTELFVVVCERHRRYRDYTRHDLEDALVEVISGFPVYRTYVVPAQGRCSVADQAYVIAAISGARARRADLDPSLLDFLADLLVLRVTGTAEARLVTAFQQLTGPAMAKGVEDTAFYVYHRLVALNEVGGDPGVFGHSVEEFHEANLDAARSWPARMLSTSTHDTKRSEDVRARLCLLSEIPGRLAQAVTRWSAIADAHRCAEMPDRNLEYLLYQTFVGAHPLSAERASAYAVKAAKEAKDRTSWTRPDPEYDSALDRFVKSLAIDPAFGDALSDFVAPLVGPGRVNSLAQLLLKLTSPGVPDIYQGQELWDLSLVDPDNRRRVDFDVRRRLLAELDFLSASEILAKSDAGLPKLAVTARALRLRRALPDLYDPGSSYEPLLATGPRANHLVAFARGEAALTVVPRLVLGLSGDWSETNLELPPGRFVDVLSSPPAGDAGAREFSGAVALDDLLNPFPVALLVRQDALGSLA